MSLSNSDLEKIRFIVNDVVTDIRADVKVLREDVRVLKEDVRVLKRDVAVLKSDVAEMKITLNSHDQRLLRVEENTLVCRRILEHNDLTEKSRHGKRIFRLESGVQKIPSVFKP